MATTPKERMRAHGRTRRDYARQRNRVPDTAARGFADEVRRESQRASRAPSEAEVLDFTEAVQADILHPTDDSR